jgi:uncharacterized membrane protein YvbJ
MVKFWASILVIFTICLLLWGLLYVEDTQSKIAVFGIVGLILTAITSILVVSMDNLKVKEREYEFMLLKEKKEVFKIYYDAYFNTLKGKGKSDKLNSQQLVDKMMEFKKGLMNWGSEELIKAYIRYEDDLIDFGQSQDVKKMLSRGNDFFKLMRKEMGYKDSGDFNILSITLDSNARRELIEK